MAKKFEEWEYRPKFQTPRNDLGGLSLGELQAIPFEELGRFKSAGKFPHGYSSETLTFYSPRDPGVHPIILWTLLQATHSVVVNMYGLDDPHAADLIRLYTEDDNVAVTLTLDSIQAAGGQEQSILRLFRNDLIGNSIAIGRSVRGAISHDKLLVVDGIYLVSGSTNWSYGGELLQDNQLTLTRDPVAAAEARSIIDMDHDAMLKQMAGRPASDFIKPDTPAPVPAGTH
jgi:phosphatidylserine/phosphatidylglycerophosphate/cardiolipin synthase-like enzyme